MIREMGNCGCIEKVQRIFYAIQSAKINKCGLAIKLDEKIYTNPKYLFSPEEVVNFEFSFNKDTMYIISEEDLFLKLNWWDIVKVNVLW